MTLSDAGILIVITLAVLGLVNTLRGLDDWLSIRRLGETPLARIRKNIHKLRDLGPDGWILPSAEDLDKLEPAEDPVDVDRLVAEFDADFKRTHPPEHKRW